MNYFVIVGNVQDFSQVSQSWSSQLSTQSGSQSSGTNKGTKKCSSARQRELKWRRRMATSLKGSSRLPVNLAVNEVQVAVEKAELPMHVFNLFELYGIMTLEDLSCVDSKMLDEIENSVSENSLAGADFSSTNSQLKFLGLETSSSGQPNRYKMKPFTRTKILNKLPGIIQLMAKEKSEKVNEKEKFEEGQQLHNESTPVNLPVKFGVKRLSNNVPPPVNRHAKKMREEENFHSQLESEQDLSTQQSDSEQDLESQKGENKCVASGSKTNAYVVRKETDQLADQELQHDLEEHAASVAYSACEKINEFWRLTNVKGECVSFAFLKDLLVKLLL